MEGLRPSFSTISSEICGRDMIAVLGPGWVSRSLAEGQAGREEAAGEKGGQAGLQPVVMEDGERAVNAPRHSQDEPDDRAPHCSEISRLDTASMQQIHFPVSGDRNVWTPTQGPGWTRIRFRNSSAEGKDWQP